MREDRKLHLSENSIRIEKERSVPLLKAFKGKRVCEIDNDAIRDYQKKRIKQVSAKTVNLETDLLRTVLKSAKVWGPLADDFKPLPKNNRGPGRALEPEEERLLFETARGKPLWDAAFYAALIASNTTMRGHELKRLRLENVDLVDRQIVIRKSKTDAGQRVIPLNPAAMWAFARLLDRAHALGSTAPEHFLFPAFRYRKTKDVNCGTGYDPTNPQKTWRTAWRSLVKEAARACRQTRRAGSLGCWNWISRSARGMEASCGAITEAAFSRSATLRDNEARREPGIGPDDHGYCWPRR